MMSPGTGHGGVAATLRGLQGRGLWPVPVPPGPGRPAGSRDENAGAGSRKGRHGQRRLWRRMARMIGPGLGGPAWCG